MVYLYNYSYNNPLNYIDPTGHIACPPGLSEFECTVGGSKTTGKETTTQGNLYDSSDWTYAENYQEPVLDWTPVIDAYNDQAGNCSGWECNPPPIENALRPEESFHYDENDPYVSRGPDFRLTSVSVSPAVLGAIPGLQSLLVLWPFSINHTRMRDRYDNEYKSWGGGIGEGLTIVSGNVSEGYLFTREVPTEQQLEEFMTGFSLNINAGAVVGGGITFSDQWFDPTDHEDPFDPRHPYSQYRDDTGWDFGLYFPQVGASASWGSFRRGGDK